MPTPSLSLQELDNKTNTPPDDKPAPEPPIKAGDGNPSPEDLAAKLAQEQKDKGNGNPAPEPTAEEKAAARVAELKAKPEDQLTAEEKAELTAATAQEEEDDDDPLAFWEDVDKLRGETVPIKWEEFKDETGNPVRPDSPQGVLIREKFLEDRAIERFEEAMRQSDPRGYQYLLHRQAGGTDEDFFAQKTTTLPEYDAFKESVDLQTAVYKGSLMAAGISEKQAKMLVDQAVKDKELFQLADKAYKDTDKREQDSIKALQQQLAREEAEYKASVNALDKLLREQVASPSLKIIIPEAKKAGYEAFVRSHVKYDETTGQFSIAQPITRETLPRMLEALYLQFANGNLSEVVQRQAQTQNTRRLRRNVDKTKETMRSAEAPASGKKTLGEI